MESSDNTETKLCNSCQSFYGRQDTNFLCSSCFKQTKPQVSHDQTPKQQTQALVALPEVEIVPPKIEETKDESNPNQKPQQKDQSKCWNCTKRVGAVINPCKCGFVFCPKHRHAETHDCKFDYFSEQKTKLAKENPVVQKSSLQFF